jgi:hypothetical protein
VHEGMRAEALFARRQVAKDLKAVQLQMAIAAQGHAQGLLCQLARHYGRLGQARLEPLLVRRAQQRIAPITQNRRLQHPRAGLPQLVLAPCRVSLSLAL